MALNTSEVQSNGIKIACFFQKLTKNCPVDGGFAAEEATGALTPDPLL